MYDRVHFICLSLAALKQEELEADEWKTRK